MDIQIRPETEGDYNAITRINDAAFSGTYESALIIKLRKNPKFIKELSLVAVTDGKVVGHILLFPIEVRGGGNSYDSLALAPMSVAPDLQKGGIGSALIKAGFEQAKKLGYASVIVLGHPTYYPKFGFEPASKFNINPPKEEWKEDFFVAELVPSALQNVSGTVVYPPEFD